MQKPFFHRQTATVKPVFYLQQLHFRGIKWNRKDHKSQLITVSANTYEEYMFNYFLLLSFFFSKINFIVEEEGKKNMSANQRPGWPPL